MKSSRSIVVNYNLVQNEVLEVRAPEGLDVYRFTILVTERQAIFWSTSKGDLSTGVNRGVPMTATVAAAGAQQFPVMMTLDRRGVAPANDVLYFRTSGGTVTNPSFVIIWEGEEKQ